MSEDVQMPLEDALIGYLKIEEFSEKFIAGLFVVDIAGMPIELRASDFVQPTSTQRIAYGNTLRRAIARAAGPALLKAMQERPALLLGDTDDFLGLHSDALPVVHLKPHDKEIELGGSAWIDEEEVLEPPVDRFAAVVLGFARSLAQEERGAIRTQLSAICAMAEFDIMEPFARLEKALAELHATQ